ncbi:hypothetical protein scyTo_0015693 [Scyliorhinus torazame]|uniref:RING-type domain-containing protein n=1 Tax=Scyliorhinus torazame TaxID=75743 RepID=A0A401PWV3_SCYTO|nr:hypothetical protein [Scyliorhinus torazame]
MEARACEEDLNCAVCHQVYRDPITLTCRHSFCLKCIEDVWPQVSDQNGFRCPCCHRKFNPEPSLEGSTPTVTCDHCGESQSPALKTCLKCETSFCPLHLKPHLTKDIFKDHELVDPPTDLTRRKCPDHKKILEYFCEDDGVCVCSSCGLTGNHRSHKIVNLDEAQDARKKKLKSEVGKLERVQQNCSIKDKDLEKSEAELKTITSELKGKLLQKFSERRKQLDKDEEYVLRMIDKEEHCRLSAIQGCSKTLQSMVEQLNLTKEEAQNLMEKDCISFIQNSEALTSKVIECQKIKYPDTPELALNLSNVSQLAKKKMEEMKQYDLAIVQVIGSYDRSVGRKESAGTTPPQRKLASPPPPQTSMKVLFQFKTWK